MSAMQAVKFQGDAGQWKMQVMAASREIYASGVTIEHFMMGCLLSSFQGKSPQVQSMMVNDINSDKVGPGMQLEELVSNYSTFIATMNSIDGPSRGINNAGLNGDRKKGGDAKFKGKCNNCGKMGHKSKDCRTEKKKTAPSLHCSVNWLRWRTLAVRMRRLPILFGVAVLLLVRALHAVFAPVLFIRLAFLLHLTNRN